MTHARQQIREAFVTTLTGVTDAGTNVFNARVYPMNTDSLPGILIYSPNETSTTDTINHPRSQTRELQVVVEAYSKTVSEADKAIDALAEQIEQAIAADPKLGGLAKDTVISQTQIAVTGDGDVPVAVGIFTFTVIYRVRENAPETLI